MARPGLLRHRKFLRLAHQLGSPLKALGALEMLWQLAYESGDAYVGTAADLERSVGWHGKRGQLTRALFECGQPEGQGFIEAAEAPDTYRIHDLWHHAPEYVSNRRAREQERRIEKTCPRCGTPYFSADPRSKFCSHACRQAHYRTLGEGAPVPSRVTDRDGAVRHALRTVTEPSVTRDGGVTDRDGGVTDRDGSPAPAPAPAPAPSTEREREKSASLSSAARDPFTDPGTTERAGRFVDRYGQLYQKHRNGARYALKPTRDYAAAVTLCQTWPDERLDKLAVIFLTTDHKFAAEGSRTIPQFLALASWADGKLAEYEHGKAVPV